MGSLSAVGADRTPLPAPPGVNARAPLFAAGLVVQGRAASGEELPAASAGWAVRYAQLGTGRCRSRYVGVHTAGLQMCVEEWSLGVLKMGRAPRGSVAFLVPVGGGPARIQGRPVRAGEVVVLFEGDDLDYRSAGRARLVTVSVERTALEGHVRALLGRRLGEVRLEGRLRGLRTDDVMLARTCHDLAARAAAHPRLLRDPDLARGLERKLVGMLLAGFETPCGVEPYGRGRALARRAEAWLRQNLAEPPTISVLCSALHVNERTLHEAFREHLGTTPKAYLKTLRLNAARHDLLRGAAKTRVTDVALDWGFLHFGWFSQDYRRLFGETPSQTLHRGRADADRRGVGGPGHRRGPGEHEEVAAAWAM